MNGIEAALEQRGLGKTGVDLHQLASELYPICRSITGNGTRETLRQIQRLIQLQIREVKSGADVFDWTIPLEWNVREAYLNRADGTRILDYRDCNLQILNYSVPMRARVQLDELKKHLTTLPNHPNWIPYRTSYYTPEWGFCMKHKQMQDLEDGEYEVVIDTTLEPGFLTYGEFYLQGQSTEEVLISAHICHPSLANDNLSGIVVACFLAGLLRGRRLRYSYRFVFVPGTIGAITWLAKNKDNAQQIRHGLVLTCVGDASAFHYKKSRRGDAEIDRAAALALRSCGEPYEVLDFSPYGYDERQYCSPGFNLPVGCLMRSVWGTFPEYHTSADNLGFIHPEKLAGTLRMCAAICDVLEGNRTYLNRKPFGEPQLGKRGLYSGAGNKASAEAISARLWVLNYSDGRHSLLDIAERSALPFPAIYDAAELLRERDLLAVVDTN